MCVCVCMIQLEVSSARNLWEGNVSGITKCKLIILSKENVFQTYSEKFVSMPDVWTVVMAVEFILFLVCSWLVYVAGLCMYL